MIKKIGELNFKGFETEIKVSLKVEKYLNDDGLSLAVLIPNAWNFYETLLFEHIDENEDGKPDEKFGKKFIMVYNGITEEGKWSKEKGLITTGFKERLKEEEKAIFYSATPLNSLQNKDKKFMANYF